MRFALMTILASIASASGHIYDLHTGDFARFSGVVCRAINDSHDGKEFLCFRPGINRNVVFISRNHVMIYDNNSIPYEGR